MTSDPSSIEQDLRNLRPAPLDVALLARLEASTSITLTQLDPDEVRFEEDLRSNNPSALSPALMSSLENIVGTTVFPQDRNILTFPQSHIPNRRSNLQWRAVAAVVALCGALTAVFMPVRMTTSQIVKANPTPALPHAALNSESLVPAGFNREFSKAQDEGVIWRSNNNAQHVLKVVYKERVTLKNAEGRTYQIEQPRVEYILLPEKSD